MKRLHFRVAAVNLGLIVALTVFAVSFLMPAPVLAQSTFTATIQGTVLDASQAAVPGATVTITNDATKVVLTRTTDGAGRYIITGLQPASYTMTVEAKDFKTLIHSNVLLRVAQATSLDFTLEVGAVATKVEVKGTPPLLNTANAALGQEVDNRYVTEVPLLNRVLGNLSLLAPGVTQVNPTSSSGTVATTGGTDFVSDGQRNATAQVRLDGVLQSSPSQSEGQNSVVAYQLPIEVAQEFKIQNSNFTAEYGNNDGTTVNVVSKSGTNQFHGVGYWFGRRPTLDSESFYGNKAHLLKAGYALDIYGGEVGGPIIKNKFFFLGSFERYRSNTPATTTTSVPTAAQLAGNFSQTFNANGTLQQIYNPFNDYVGTDGLTHRTAFTGNIIPSNLLDPIGMKIASYFPAPTSAGNPITGLSNFTANGASIARNYNTTWKTDYNFPGNSRLTVRYSDLRPFSAAPLYYHTAGDSASHANSHDQNAGIGYTRIFSPTLIGEVRFGVNRTHIAQANDSSVTQTQLGFPSNIPWTLPGFPYVTTGYAALGISTYTDTVEAGTQYNLLGAVTKIKGAHTLKFGAEQTTFFSTYYQAGAPEGQFAFSNATTDDNPLVANALEGNGLASLLLGWGSSGSMNVTQSPDTKSKHTSFFAQDDWRVTKRLTVNVGLRYDWDTPATERWNRELYPSTTLDSGINLPGLGEIYGGLIPMTPDHRHVKVWRNDWGPRLGFAYQLNPKTVLRTGGGLYYGYPNVNDLWNPSSTLRKAVPVNWSFDSGITRYASLENPFPTPDYIPQGNKYGKLAQWGYDSGVMESDNEARQANIYQWSSGIQRQITDTLLLEVNYVGNRTTHSDFYLAQNMDFVSAANRTKWGSTGLYSTVANPFYPLFQGPSAIFNEPDSAYNQPTFLRYYLLRPFPQYSGTFWDGRVGTQATSRYNAFEVRFEKRYSHGLNFVGGYTYSHFTSLSDSSTDSPSYGDYIAVQDYTNLAGEQSLSAADTPNRFVVGFSYQLPIGMGRAVGSSWGRGKNALLGGWQTTGLFTYQTGFPLNVSSASGSLADAQQLRPNISGNPRNSSCSIKDVVNLTCNYFNASAYSVPADQTPGNSPRMNGAIRDESIRNIDASFFKNFNIRENIKAQFRMEFFNFINNPRFADPSAAYTSAAFGTISAQKNSARQGQLGVRFLF